MRHLLFAFLAMTAGTFLVGCSTCSNCVQHHDFECETCDEPVSSWPKLDFKKSKHKHKKDHCPLCTSSSPSPSGCSSYAGGMQWNPEVLAAGCSGCAGGNPMMGMASSSGCSSCGVPSFNPPASGGCSSCGTGPHAQAPVSGCSSCGSNAPHQSQHGIPQMQPHGDCPHCRNNAPGAIYEGDLTPGAQHHNLTPSPAPAPPADEKPAPATLPMNNSTTLIPILPPTSSPRHVHWVPTPVK